MAGDQSSDNRSGEIRWQAERRAAMESAVQYSKAKHKALRKRLSDESSTSLDNSVSPTDDSDSFDVVDNDDALNAVKGNIVWAGLEPMEFIALFPDWIERKDVGQINIQVKFHRLLNQAKNSNHKDVFAKKITTTSLYDHFTRFFENVADFRT